MSKLFFFLLLPLLPTLYHPTYGGGFEGSGKGGRRSGEVSGQGSLEAKGDAFGGDFDDGMVGYKDGKQGYTTYKRPSSMLSTWFIEQSLCCGTMAPTALDFLNLVTSVGTYLRHRYMYALGTLYIDLFLIIKLQFGSCPRGYE